MEINLSSLHASSEGIYSYCPHILMVIMSYLYITLFLQNIVQELPALNMPDVCTNVPMHGKAFSANSMVRC